jgi:sporulation integral membrane protein YlbJ
MKDHGSLYRKCVVYIFPALALMLALYAKETSEAARDAIYLCLDVVIPSLFPFFVLSRLTVPFLKSFSCPRHLRRLIQGLTGLPCYVLPAIVLGYLSGYPTGAKLVRDMLDEGFLDSSQASRVIAIANNCSPLFIIGTVGAGLFRSIRIGFILLAVHWVSGLLAALALNLLLKKRRSQANAGTVVFQGSRIENKNNRGIAALIPGAIEDAAVLSLKVSGYIVLFAVLSELMHKTGFFSLVANALSAILPGSLAGNTISALLRGIMEIASGSSAIALTVNSPVIVQLSLVSFICGFAGFSVHTQVMGIMKGTKSRYGVFLLGKALHGIIACILTIAVLKLLPVSLAASGFRPAITGIPPDFRIFTIMTLIMALLASPYENGGRIRHPDKS